MAIKQNVVLETLKIYNLDIANCGGQSYDNASNMSGVYSGLKARIKLANHVIFVPCSAHSFNHVSLSIFLQYFTGSVHFFLDLDTQIESYVTSIEAKVNSFEEPLSDKMVCSK